MTTASMRSAAKRVLVADDSEVAAELLATTLADHGFDVITAGGGAAAIDVARVERPDVIVCDLHMPEVDGLAVLQAVAGFDGTIPVVVLSGDSDVETVLHAIHEGAFDYVRKGDGDDALVRAVRRATAHGEVLRDNRRLTYELRLAQEALELGAAERAAQLADANGRLEASVAAQGRTEARFRSLVQHASDLIVVTTMNGVVTYESPSAQRLLGRGIAERTGASIFRVVHAEDRERARAAAAEVMASPGASTRLDLRFVHQDGSARWMEVHLGNLTGEPSVGGLVWTCRDVSDRVALETKLSREARIDSLTDLGNRRLLRERLEEALARARAARSPLGILVIDLDDFKPVNDSLGHAIGDEVLVSAARRLRAAARAGDTAARLGGDDFALVLPGAGAAESTAVAARVVASLAEPHRVGGVEILLGASVGVAVSAAGAEGPDELLRNADLAMHVARRRGGGYEIFQPDMHAAMATNVAMRLDLRRAVERQEFFLEYQPVVSIATGSLVGVEALVRWRHPERGIVPPGVFISLAEDTGLIVPLGRWVLREACAMLARRGGGFAISVNVSARQLFRDDLVDDVASALETSGLDPKKLVLEVTESVALEERQPILHALRKLGVRLAIDDFGTGYSSLAYLRRLPVDAVKIHKSFVDGVAHDAGDAQLARAILRFGQEMGLSTTAEGIEHAEQWSALRDLGCDLGQGYYFSRPVGEERLAAAIAGLPSPNGAAPSA
jgi:diguanylate cyclase (GGDEF)-like protein/PAS domain S-box-containing protein